MPKTSTHLSESEVKKACAYWVEKGCPKPQSCDVYLHVDQPTNPTQFDPGNGVTATVS